MRKTIDYTVTTDGRDKGKVFRLTEMPSKSGEKWAEKCLNIMSKSRDGFNPSLLSAGWAGIAAMGVSSFAAGEWTQIEPLLDEMFRCVKVVPDPSKPHVVRPLIDNDSDGDDIEEIRTRLELRQEVIELHAGFFKAAVNWILTAARQGLQQHEAEKSSQNTSTSPLPSEP